MADKRRTGSNPLSTFLSQIPDYVGDEAQKKQSKSETETKPNAKTKTQTQTETIVKPETDTITKTIAESETKAKPKTETESKTITNTETFTQAETFANTFANEIKVKAAGQSEAQRFEDSRKRQTYWLDPETIEMITELAKRSGTNKYHVVSAGVRLLYDYVFESRRD